MDKVLRIETTFKTGRTTIKKMSKAEYTIYKEECLRNQNIDDVRIIRDK